MGNRYDQLLAAVREKQPRAILEIGTWNGVNAEAMLSLCPTAKYYGFDLFEDGNPQTDREELNVKAHYYMDRVFEKLSVYDVELFKGNTRETLATFDRPVDFVWIDGGHSLETIRSDWENVKRVITPDAWVFFDDYYIKGVDVERYGCNKVVEELKHEVLPNSDSIKNGGRVAMVRVYP